MSDNTQMPAVVGIEEILIGKRHRGSGDTRHLEQSIKEFGLLNPVVLRLNPEFEAGVETVTAVCPYILVAGLNRVEAHKKLGIMEIPAVVRSIDEVTAEMLEIDENLARIDLSTLERSLQLKRRQELYNLKHGVRQGKPTSGDAPRFDEDAGGAAGISASSVRRAVAMAKKLDPEAAEKLKGTRTADNLSELTRLAGVDKEFQSDIAELVAGNGMTVVEAQAELQKTNALIPDPVTDSTEEKFEKNILASEGKLRYAERLLREDINLNESWTAETQLDLRDHLHNIQDTLGKILARFDASLNPDD